MVADLSGAYVAAAEYAVPLVKAFSQFHARGNAIHYVSDHVSVWSFVAGSSGGPAGSTTDRELGPRWRPRLLGRLTTGDHIARLTMLHPDDRLVYLSELGFSDDEVATCAEVVDRWLDICKPSLEAAAGQAFKAGEGLDWIMDAWRRASPYEKLGTLIQGYHISQPEPLVGYAVCSATEFALSMLVLHELDSEVAPILGGTDTDWAGEDERIASLGLLDEVSQWPE